MLSVTRNLTDYLQMRWNWLSKGWSLLPRKTYRQVKQQPAWSLRYCRWSGFWVRYLPVWTQTCSETEVIIRTCALCTSHWPLRPFTIREEVREVACGGRRRRRRSLMFKKFLNVNAAELFWSPRIHYHKITFGSGYQIVRFGIEDFKRDAFNLQQWHCVSVWLCLMMQYFIVLFVISNSSSFY